MSDEYERDDYDERQDIVNSFSARERIGTRGGMATSIEGGSKLAKMQEQRNFYDRGLRLQDAIENYFMEIRNTPQGAGFSQSNLNHIKDIFEALPYKLYKNPYMLVLAYILTQTIRKSGTKIVEELIKETRQENISLPDVIRYYRLLQSNPHLQ